ncbi:hypothetical protein WMY93_032810 [Mugilogobius chulae]|uniref:C2 domain-containing protein n=1 Tax=Mugilogobius chulae TaxID=88201 RepID=A0AAW0MPS7_9GOBI
MNSIKTRIGVTGAPPWSQARGGCSQMSAWWPGLCPRVTWVGPPVGSPPTEGFMGGRCLDDLVHSLWLLGRGTSPLWGKEPELMQEVERYRLDIVGLTSGTQLLERGWTLHFSGVAQGERQSWCGSAQSHSSVMCLTRGSRPFTFGSGTGLSLLCRLRTKQQSRVPAYWSSWEEYWTVHPLGTPLFYWGTSTTPVTPGEERPLHLNPSVLLLDFCVSYSLSITNPMFQHKSLHQWLQDTRQTMKDSGSTSSSHVKPDVVGGEKTAFGPERHGIKAGLSGLRTMKLTADTMKIAVLLLLLLLPVLGSSACKTLGIKILQGKINSRHHADVSGLPDPYVYLSYSGKTAHTRTKEGYKVTFNNQWYIHRYKPSRVLTLTMYDDNGWFRKDKVLASCKITNAKPKSKATCKAKKGSFTYKLSC